MMKLSKSLPLFTLVIGLLSPSLRAIAVTPESSLSKGVDSQTLISLGFPPAPAGQQKITGGTGGGGTRIAGGGCVAPTGLPSLTPIMPQNQVGQTFKGNPSIFLYVPQTRAKSAEFVVMDTEGNYVYTQKFNLPDKAGIVKIEIPEKDQKGQPLALKADQLYLWEFAIICNSSDRSSDVYAWGTLNRPQFNQTQITELNQALTQTNNPLKEAEIFAQYRLWNETVEMVAQVRDSQPNEWQELLNSVGIKEEAIIQAPLMELQRAN